MQVKVVVLLLSLCVAGVVLAEHGPVLPDRPRLDAGHDSTATTAKSVTINSYSPQWSVLEVAEGPNNFVTVEGCGFRTFAEVTCVFDWRFTSSRAFIQSDSVVICELPSLGRHMFDTLPQQSRLDLVFDGDQEDFTIYVGGFRWGPELSCSAPINPTRGPTSGGALTVIGEGFSDAQLAGEELNVWLDNTAATDCAVVDDGTISCAAIPTSDEINRFALVSVTWGTPAGTWWDRSAAECYLHSTVLYRYGPVVSSTSPACVSPFGGDRITIHGVGFDDPLFAATNPLAPNNVDDLAAGGTAGGVALGASLALIEVSVPSPPQQVTDGTPTVLQVWGLVSADGLTIEFQAPDWVSHSRSLSTAYRSFLKGQDASVRVLFRQVNSMKDWAADGAINFHYGPLVYSVDDGADRHWHQGGGEHICVSGCGFANFTNSDVTIEFTDGNTPICSDAEVIEGDTICCTFRGFACNRETTWEHVQVAFQPGRFLGVGGAERIATGTDDLQVHVGPIIAEIGTEHSMNLAVTPDGPITVTGENLLFSTTTGWAAPVSINAGSKNYQQALSLSNSDTELTYHIGLAEFDASASYSFSFTPPTGASNPANSGVCNVGSQLNIHFGPTCDAVSPWHGHINGGDSLSITGQGFAHYKEARVQLCDNGLGVNSATGGQRASTCGAPEEVENLTRDDTLLTFTTGVYQTDADRNRGRRVWGQNFDVVVFFDSAQDLLYTSGTSQTYAQQCSDCDDGGQGISPPRQPCTPGGCTSAAKIQCGGYRFGPVTDHLTPCRGTIAGGEVVTVGNAGSAIGAFDDAWSDKRVPETGLPRNWTPHIASFGVVLGEWANQTVTDNTFEATTVWNWEANTDQSVVAYFDSCNMTEPAAVDGSDIVVHWGPRFAHGSKPDEHHALTYTSTFDDDARRGLEEGDDDLYGFVPSGATTQAVYVTGLGFHEFCTAEECNAHCVIDGVSSTSTSFITKGDPKWEMIRCEVPHRPFGTRASVCIQFGVAPCNEHNDPWSGEPETEWRHVVCADEYIWFTPKLYGLGGSYGLTSGGEPNHIHAVGLTDFPTPRVYVGQFPATGVALDGDTDIDYVGPSYAAEFNTDVSVRVEWPVPAGFGEGEDFEGCNENDHHWAQWVTEQYHYGPVCSGISSSAGPIYSTNSVISGSRVLREVDITGDGFRDCDDITGNGPQFSGEFQLPWQNGEGVRRCTFRYMYVYYAFDGAAITIDGTRAAANQIAVQHDRTAASNNPDVTAKINIPVHAAGCGTAHFALYFPDVLVSTEEQRTVACPDSDYWYGPSVNSVDAWYTATHDEQRYAYGWGYGLDSTAPDPSIGGVGEPQHSDFRITVSGSAWDDNFFTENEDGTNRVNIFEPSIIFAGTPLSVNTLQTLGANSISQRVAPNGNFGDERVVGVEWFRGGTGGACQLISDTIFHYGPVVTESGRDRCTDAVGLGVGTDTTYIDGHAFECCGFPALNSGSNERTLTSWPGGQNLDLIGGTSSDTRTTSRAWFTIPPHSNPATRAYGFGLHFTSAVQAGTTTSQRVCVDGHLMDVCFGPKAPSAWDRARYSGLFNGDTCPRSRTSTRQHEFEISGVHLRGNIASVDCVYAAGEDEEMTLGHQSWTETLLECDVPAWRKQCGDAPSNLTLHYHVSGTGQVYIQQEFLYPNSVDVGGALPAFVAEGGDIVHHTLAWGPWITKLASETTGSNTGSVSATEVRTNVHHSGSGHSLTWQLANYQDYVCHNDHQRFNEDQAVCLFGHRRRHDGNVRNSAALATVGASGLVRCDIPDGDFGDSAWVRVLLNPHVDQYTEHLVDGGRDEVGWWHWHARVDQLSQSWRARFDTHPLDSLTVYGGGFCSYTWAVCHFDDWDVSVQGDIVQDNMVVCQPPPVHPVGASVVSVTLCDDCDCLKGCDATADKVASLDTYIYPGAIDAWPLHGPVSGGTTIELMQFGLENYEKVECHFHLAAGDIAVEATPAGDSYQCVSPTSGSVEVAALTIVGHVHDFVTEPLSTFWFDFGWPTITSISPLSVEAGQDTVVTVAGEYLNANIPGGLFECIWQHGPVPTSDHPREPGEAPTFAGPVTVDTTATLQSVTQRLGGNGRLFNTFQVHCPTPEEKFQRIGAYPFEIRFGSDLYQSQSNFEFDVVVNSALEIQAWQSNARWNAGSRSSPNFFIPSFPNDNTITLYGVGLFGGRGRSSDHTSGYLCRFDSVSTSESAAYTVGYFENCGGVENCGDFVNCGQTDCESVVCPLAPRDLSEFDKFADVPVAVSVDSGYSFSRDFPVQYLRDKSAEDCLNASSSLQASFILLCFSALALLSFFLY